MSSEPGRHRDDQVRAAFDLLTEDADHLAGLRQRLGEQAAVAGLLDVSWTSISTPVGRLLLAATPRGLVRVHFGAEEEFLAELATRVSPRVLSGRARLDALLRQLDEYFEGRRTQFEVPLDLQLCTGFRREVVEHLRTIEYAGTESYAQVAAAVGRPRAVRAAGTACARNPLPVVVPCHRVVRSDGSVGQYAGGAAAKRALLALEAG